MLVCLFSRLRVCLFSRAFLYVFVAVPAFVCMFACPLVCASPPMSLFVAHLSVDACFCVRLRDHVHVCVSARRRLFV